MANELLGESLAIYVSGSLVASQTNFSLNENRDVVDITSKESNNRRYLPGKYSSTFTADALYIPTSSYRTMSAAMRGSGYVICGIYGNASHPASGTLQMSCSALVNGLSLNAPDGAPSTYNANFTVDGAWYSAV